MSHREVNDLPLVTCLLTEGAGFQTFLLSPWIYSLEITLGDKHYSLSFSEKKLEAGVVEPQTGRALEHEGTL